MLNIRGKALNILLSWLLTCVAGASLAQLRFGNLLIARVEDESRLSEKDISVVEFAFGQSTVTDKEKGNLRSLADSVRNDLNLKEIVIAAWSDKEYPVEESLKLMPSDRRLADNRASEVRAVLLRAGISYTKISTHSMAVHPGWLAKTFHFKDAILKGDVAIKTSDDRIVASVGKQLRDKGGPGKVVAVIVRADSFSAH
jgi:hypothetical protein